MDAVNTVLPTSPPGISDTTTPPPTPSEASLCFLIVKFCAGHATTAKLLTEISQLLRNPDVSGVSIAGSHEAVAANSAVGDGSTERSSGTIRMPREALQAQIYKLQGEIGLLRDQNAELQDRLQSVQDDFERALKAPCPRCGLDECMGYGD